MRREVVGMTYLVKRKCMTALCYAKYLPIEGHQDTFEVDVDYERKLQALPIWPKAWIDGYYWEHCEVCRKRFFGGYGTRDWVRNCLWSLKEGNASISPDDIRAVGLKTKDFPSFEWNNVV